MIWSVYIVNLKEHREELRDRILDVGILYCRRHFIDYYIDEFDTDQTILGSIKSKRLDLTKYLKLVGSYSDSKREMVTCVNDIAAVVSRGVDITESDVAFLENLSFNNYVSANIPAEG